MAGTIIESELTRPRSPATRFALATETDDAAIRRLLRDNPMRGAISVSFEREPSCFRGSTIAGARDQVILALENKRLVCIGRCSVSDRHVNGKRRRVGYLSELRLDASARGRFDILRRGYQFFHELQHSDPADLYFTSITTDNERSLRFLRRGLPGLPAYEPLTEFVSLFIPVPRRPANRVVPNPHIVAASAEHRSALATFLNAQAGQYHLATAWDEEKLRSLEDVGLALSDFMLWIDAGKIVGCAALWDQRRFRQTVIRGYNRSLSFARPLLNAAATLFGTPGLPPVGHPLKYAFLSPLTATSDEVLAGLVQSSLGNAKEGGLDFVALGFSVHDPRLAVVQNQFRCRAYRSLLFQVRWPDFPAFRPDDRLIFPEIALL